MGVAERKERDKLARRRDILNAARECFFKRGFEDTTIQQIAERVELSTGTIYLYFKSKEEIYISILEEGLDILVALFRSAINPVGSATENMNSLVRAFVRFHRDYGEYLDIMAFMRLSGERESRMPDDLRMRVQERVEECYSLVENAIQNGIDSGELREVNTRDFARILWSLLTGLVLSFERQSTEEAPISGSAPPPSLEHLIDMATSLILDGVRVHSDQPAPSS